LNLTRHHFTDPHSKDGYAWRLFIIYKVFTNLLSLRAAGFIKFHIYRGFNTTGGFVENMIGMFISSITKKKTFINLGCKL
jgi:hypothetical protein